jgi:hypothetical protein
MSRFTSTYAGLHLHIGDYENNEVLVAVAWRKIRRILSSLHDRLLLNG